MGLSSSLVNTFSNVTRDIYNSQFSCLNDGVKENVKNDEVQKRKITDDFKKIVEAGKPECRHFADKTEKIYEKNIDDVNCCVESVTRLMTKTLRLKLQASVYDIARKIVDDSIYSYLFCFGSPKFNLCGSGSCQGAVSSKN